MIDLEIIGYIKCSKQHELNQLLFFNLSRQGHT